MNVCRNDGGFNHNAQALRICELLETSYPEFPGLESDARSAGRPATSERQASADNCETAVDDERADSPLLEVQVVDAADSIAYDAHDADDALGVRPAARWSNCWKCRCGARRASASSGGRRSLNDRQLRRAIVHEVIDWQVSDVIEQSLRALAEQRVESVADVRQSPPIILPSAELAEKKVNLERFLFDKVYRHPGVLAQAPHGSAGACEKRLTCW